MQVDVIQGLTLGVLGVLEAHVVKVDGAVGNVGDGLGGIGNGRGGVEHLDDTVRALVCHGDHDKDHRELHEAHEDLETVGKDRGELTHVKQGSLARDDDFRPQVDDGDKGAVDADVHHGVVKGQELLGAGEVGANVAGGTGEFLLLVVFAHIALYHAHAGDVFLDRLVERIVLMKDARKDGAHLKDDEEQAKAQDRDDD